MNANIELIAGRVGMRFSGIFFLLLALGLGGGFSQVANAGSQDEIERRDLALIQAQFDQILIIVNRLEKRQLSGFKGDSRIVLNTAALRNEVNLIRDGIEAYLQPPRFQARQLETVKGDYLRRGR